LLNAACEGRRGRKGSSFSEEKEAKTLLSIGARGPIQTARRGPRKQMRKSLFASFSSEKDESGRASV
jgi:hypothetical protein